MRDEPQDENRSEILLALAISEDKLARAEAGIARRDEAAAGARRDLHRLARMIGEKLREVADDDAERETWVEARDLVRRVRRSFR